MHRLGFFGFVLPWLLTFAVVYGLLAKTKVLGEDLKVVGVTAMVIAFFVTGFGGVAFGLLLSSMFGMAIIILATIIIIVLFAAMTGFDMSAFTDHKGILAVLIGIGILIFFTVGAASVLKINISGEVASIIFVLILMAVAVYFIAGKK